MASRPSAQTAGIQHGWRSGLEEQIGDQLTDLKIPFTFEELVIPFSQPQKTRRYTPDFVLPNGIIIESKGRFETADRSKHLWVREQHPDLDIRFIFSNSRSRISKRSKTTYAAWSNAKGFKFADKYIPEAWIFEANNRRSLRAIAALQKGS